MISVIKPDCGESIEEMLRRTTNTKEPIESIAPMIYTERKDGVKAEYNIRTDRFDIALEAMDKFARSGNAHRDEMNKEQMSQTTTEKND